MRGKIVSGFVGVTHRGGKDEKDKKKQKNGTQKAAIGRPYLAEQDRDDWSTAKKKSALLQRR